MAEPEGKFDPRELRLRARIGGMRKLAAVALLWESLWPAFWPAILIAGTFLALALFDVLPMLTPWLHGLVLLAFACGFGFAAYRARGYLRLPGRHAAERRIERASDLPHRPLAALDDRPAESPLTPAQSEVWRVHRERMAAAIKRLRIGFPHAGLAARDPFGLRVILALVLIVAIVDAKGDAGRRLMRAVSPHFPSVAAAAPTLDVWVAPPDYTGLPTVVLAKGAAAGAGGEASRRPTGEVVHVPAGSTLFAQVHGGRNAPTLRLGKKDVEFAPLGDDSFQARTALREPAKLSIEQNHGQLASWTLAVVPDLPPSIDFKDKPTQSERGALRISFRVADDYGVVAAKGIITRAAGAEAPGGGAPKAGDGDAAKIEVPLPLPGGRVTKGEGASYHDLTAHPWAGTNVTLRLEAKDGAGQTGTSDPVTFILPERQFHNEVAKAIIAARKRLTLDPSARRQVAGALALLEADPSRFHDDIVVFLALNSAVDRLLLDRTAEAIPSVQSLLWDTALRLEDEGASLAQRDLRDIEKKLQDALAKNADPQEIKRLMDQLQQAMDRYLEAMAQDFQNQQAQQGQQEQQGQPEPQTGQGQSYRPEDLREMLNKARQLAEMGDKQAAQQMLSRLQDILENLQTPRAADSQAQKQAREAMKNMRDLIKRQQDLLDRSYEAAKPPLAPGAPPEAQPGRPGGEPPQGMPGEEARGKPGQQGKPGRSGAASPGAAEQEALRKELGDTMLKFGDMLGKIPGELGRAERAMRDAEEALRQGDPGEAVGPQTKAVDQLQQAMESLRQEMAKRNQDNQPGGAGPGPSGQGRDPLGRPLPDRGGQGANTGDVRIPDQMELRHAREILDELRRRAGEPQRPEEERDYIDRLLPAY